VDRAWLDTEVDVLEGLDPPETLTDAAYFDVGLRGIQPLSPAFLNQVITTGVQTGLRSPA
jgi:hypothetical protein